MKKCAIYARVSTSDQRVDILTHLEPEVLCLQKAFNTNHAN
jgi:predicted site-specific integrase-resolvase